MEVSSGRTHSQVGDIQVDGYRGTHEGNVVVDIWRLLDTVFQIHQKPHFESMHISLAFCVVDLTGIVMNNIKTSSFLPSCYIPVFKQLFNS